MIMPERLAAGGDGRPVTKIVGSGPYRFVASDYVSGAQATYARFAAYQPRPSGEPSGTAGPKLAFFDRVQWQIVPESSTAVASLQSGEADWIDFLLPDLAALVRRDPRLVVRVLEPQGLLAVLRLNHLQPPLNNPAIRRALLGAIDQDELMQALAGNEKSYRHTPVGVFCPGSAMANDAGLEVFTAPRDYAAVRRNLAAAGYNGETVALLVAADLPQYSAICTVLADEMKRAGLVVDHQAMDWGTIIQRRENRGPVTSGGWSGFLTNGWYGTDMLTPVTHTSLRGNGAQGWTGWPDSPTLEALRRAWMAADTLAEQQRIARQMQLQAWIDVPYIPLGQNMQPSAYRGDLDGILNGFPIFWNVRRQIS
jgi:peptide/nickel transport system substrate-binding protein